MSGTVRVAPSAAGRCSQWAETTRMLVGFGIARAHAASSAIQSASSSRTGAPCAAKITGIRGASAAPRVSSIAAPGPLELLHAELPEQERVVEGRVPELVVPAALPSVAGRLHADVEEERVPVRLGGA